jgi:anti-sigma regulatory factor (Ser/Thr protein kinase)
VLTFPCFLVLSRTLELRSERREIGVLSRWVEAFADEVALAPERRVNLQVALEEVATNIIRHGYGEGGGGLFWVTLRREEDEIEAVVEDEAPAFDPWGRAEVDVTLPLEERAVGGLGIHLVRSVMDRVGYERRGARNVVTLGCGRLEAAAPAGPGEAGGAEGAGAGRADQPISSPS